MLTELSHTLGAGCQSFEKNLFEKPQGDHGCKGNKFFQTMHQVFFAIGNEAAFLVLILYWSLLYHWLTNVGSISATGANVQLISGMIAIADLFISGVPIRVWHLFLCLWCDLCHILLSYYKGCCSGLQ